MKRLFYPTVFFCILLFVNCGKHQQKKGNKKLAQHYFKLALLELSEPERDLFHYKKSLAHLDQALLHDMRPKYLALRATLLFKLGQLEQSKKDYERALHVCDDANLKSEILNNYACLLAQMGYHDKALELFNTLITDIHYLTPEVAMVNMGKIFAEQNEVKRAQHYFQQAVTLSPAYLDAHFYLAWAAYMNQDVSLVKHEIKTLLYLDPECKAAHHLEGLLKQA